jgi:preprotein translocase subunit YajC
VGQLASFLPLVAIALLFWLMVVRPASRRQKAVAQLQADLQPGQRVMLSSGIYGTVRSLADDRARIEIAPGTEVEVARAAISVVDTPTDPTDPTALPGDQVN